MTAIRSDAEERRLKQARESGVPWRKWGPYLSERQWGTVREDSSADGSAWESFPHDQARSRSYRWGEDGLAGVSDDKQRLCFALALWNGRDPILKERLFGLTNREGNHGEDVKEYYYYLDSTPTHSYMKWLYKYPQRAYPYDDLVATNRRSVPHRARVRAPGHRRVRGGRYFDVFAEFAKGVAGGPAHPRHGREPRAGGRVARRSADAVVPQHVERDVRRERNRSSRARRAGRRVRSSRRPTRSSASGGSTSRATCRSSSRRTRRTTSACSARRTPAPSSRTASTTTSSTAA